MAGQSRFSSFFVWPFSTFSIRRVLGTVIGLALLMTAPGLQCFAITAVAAGDVDAGLSTSRRADRKQAEHQTRALAGLMARYRRADAAGKAALHDELVERAGDRQALLGALVQIDPAGALRVVLPEKVRFGMPDAVRELLTQKATLQGELTVAYEDYPDGRHRLRHILETETGRFELQWVKHAGHLQSGTPVRVRGRLFAHGGETMGTLVLDDAPDSLALLADDADTATTTATAEVAVLPNTLGEQRILVLLVNFQDNPVQPWTLEQARETVFGTVNDFYMENSYGRTWLSGDVYGYYTLPIDGVCDTVEIETHTRQAAMADGIDLGIYNRLIYVFPQIEGCGWTGKGTVGGDPSRSWINGALDLRTVGHELGHNLGLQHAKRLECGDNTIGGDCYTVEYGDSLDIMGSPGFTGNFNAFNKELLGWLQGDPSTASGRIIVANTDGSFQLGPYETTSGDTPKALKILRGVDSLSGRGLWYYLEYRQPLGFDTYLAAYPAITKGTVFHLGTENDSNSSQWIDMTPASASADWNDAVLPIGSAYIDPDAGVTLTTEWADATGASVNVSYTGPSCIASSPALSLSPSESAWVPAGDTVAYTVWVTNRDSVGCPSADFSVTAALPAGWTAEGGGLNLAPGAGGTVTLNVTSDPAALDGFYDIPVSVQKSSDPDYGNSGVVTYVVDTPAPDCTAADPTVWLSDATGGPAAAGTPVTYGVTVTNQDSGACAVSTFDVAAEVPAGWRVSGAAVDLTPGDSAVVDITVTSAADAADGVYGIAITAENLANVTYSGSAPVTCTVANPVPACVPADPVLSLSADMGTAVPPGSPVEYALTVANQDGSGCDVSDFRVFAELPDGWRAEAATVTLAPGTVALVGVVITSPVDAGEGVYEIVVHAENTADPSHGAGTVVTYRIAASPNTAPIAMDDTVFLADKNAVAIDVLDNDSDPDGDPLTVTQVSQGTQGSVQIGAGGTLIYVPEKNFKGSDSFIYTVSDGDKTADATVNVSLMRNVNK